MVNSISAAQPLRYLTAREILKLTENFWECPTCYEPATMSPVICHDIRHSVHAECELPWLEKNNWCCSICQAKVTENSLFSREVQYPLSDALWTCAATIAEYAKIPFVRISSLAGISVISGFWTGYSLLIPVGLLIQIGGFSMLQENFEDKGVTGPTLIEHLKTRLDVLKKNQEAKIAEIETIEAQLIKENAFLGNLSNYRERLPEGAGAFDNTVQIARELANSLRQKREELRTMERQWLLLDHEYLGLRNNEDIIFHENIYSVCKAAKCLLAVVAGSFVLLS
jgi:hypothetical protein